MNGNTNPNEINYRVMVSVVPILLNNQPLCNGLSLRGVGDAIVFPDY